MLLPRLGALLLAAKIVYAVQNTSPFLLVSSDPYVSLEEAQLMPVY